MVIAYLRVSTGKQTLANQQNEISKFSRSRNLTVDRWVTETVSGRKKGRDRKLGALVRRMHKGDTLIVTELSRLSRTLTDIMAIVGELLERQVHLYSTKDHYAFDDTINSKVLCFAFGLVAELERNLISLRTNRREIAVMMNCGRPIAEICRQYGVARTTFVRFRKTCLCPFKKGTRTRWRVNGRIRSLDDVTEIK